jgi:hypothetical protein
MADGPKFFIYNRRVIEEWCYYFSELYQQGYSSGVPSHQVLEKVKREAVGPLSHYFLMRLDNPAVWESHKVLLEAVNVLAEGRPRWYTTLRPVYFWESANPTLVDVWRDKAIHGETKEDRAGAKEALRHHDKALDYMAGYVCRRLPQVSTRVDKEGKVAPREKLEVIVPAPIEQGRKKYRRDRRREAWNTFCELLEDHERANAIKLGAKKTGYSLSEFRYIVRKYDSGEKSP